MHAEVVGICGESGDITPDHVNQMMFAPDRQSYSNRRSYTEMVIKESLRMWPVASFTTRTIETTETVMRHCAILHPPPPCSLASTRSPRARW